MEEEEQGSAGQSEGKASESGQPMDVDNQGKAAATVVDATKVVEKKEPEKEGEDQPSWADVEEDTTL